LGGPGEAISVPVDYIFIPKVFQFDSMTP